MPCNECLKYVRIYLIQHPVRFYNDCFGASTGVVPGEMGGGVPYPGLATKQNNDDANAAAAAGSDWIPMRQLYNAHRL